MDAVDQGIGNLYRYIDMAGENGLIRIRNAQDTLWELLLEFETCLETGNPNFIDEIDITDAPEAGIPIDLCE